jgi:site-specific DNA recombinase
VSRTNGVWTGGIIPFGYKSVERKLVIDEKFAPLVRFMFQRFVELRSPELLAQEMNAKVLDEYSDEDMAFLKEFYRKRMYKVLINPIYKGYIAHHGEHYKGQHEAIVDEALWDEVQKILHESGPISKKPIQLDFALKSRVRCKECDRAMIVSKTAKGSRKYAYYTCLSKHNGLNCKGLDMNVNAELVHRLVIKEVRKILKEPEILGGLWQKLSEGSYPEEAYKKLQNLDKAWDLLPPADQNKVIQDFVKTVWIGRQSLTIEFMPGCADGTSSDTQEIIVIPGAFYNRKSKPQAFVYKEDGDEECDPVLLKALVQAEIWSNEMERGTYCAYKEIAEAYGLDEQYVRRTFYLTYLSPKIKEAILFGKLSPSLSLLDFKKHRPSQDWEVQEAEWLNV